MNIIIVCLFGLIAGFLVNYLSDVLPTQRSLVRPVCVHCGATYTIIDYLLLKTCRACNKYRSLRTYLTLAGGVLLSLLLWLYPPNRMGFGLGMLVLAYFAVVVVIDIENRLILHVVSLAGALIGLATGTIRLNLVTSLVGGAAGLVIMLIFYWFGILFARYRARKLGHDDGEEALGFGDVTLSTVLGLMLGFPLIIYGLVIGILLGGLISLLLVIYLLITRRYETMTVFTAYGPYLVMGAIILLYFPQTLSILLGK